MRICYLADAGSIHTQRWVEYFAGKGHDVHLLSYRPWGGNDIQNAKLYLLKTSPLPINLLSHIIQIRKLLGKTKPDILHAHYISTYGFLGALTGFRPLILSAWGSDIMVGPKKSRISKLKVKFALRKAKLTLTTSQYLKEYLRGRFGLPQHSVRAIPWGNDLTIFHEGYETEVKELRSELGIDPSFFVVLSPRHCREHYRIEYIVRAMPYIVAKHSNVMLILLRGAAQDREYESKIDKLSTELGVSEYIRMIRQELRPQQMAVLYNASNVLISIPFSDQFSGCVQGSILVNEL